MAAAGDDPAHRRHRSARRRARFEPRSAVGPDRPAPSFWSRISTSPSMTSANSSCGGGPPLRGALGPDRLDDVLAVLARPRPSRTAGTLRRDLEDVGEGVALGIVIDDVDLALLVVGQRAESGRVRRHVILGARGVLLDRSRRWYAIRSTMPAVRHANIVHARRTQSRARSRSGVKTVPGPTATQTRQSRRRTPTRRADRARPVARARPRRPGARSAGTRRP